MVVVVHVHLSLKLSRTHIFKVLLGVELQDQQINLHWWMLSCRWNLAISCLCQNPLSILSFQDCFHKIQHFYLSSNHSAPLSNPSAANRNASFLRTRSDRLLQWTWTYCRTCTFSLVRRLWHRWYYRLHPRNGSSYVWGPENKYLTYHWFLRLDDERKVPEIERLFVLIAIDIHCEMFCIKLEWLTVSALQDIVVILHMIYI